MSLCDVSPARSPHDVTDGHLGNAEGSGQSLLGEPTTRIEFSDSHNIHFGQLRCRVHSAWHPALSTLSDFVRHVVGRSAKEPMGRVLAWRVVTGMAYEHPIGDWADEMFVSPAVCWFGTNIELAVTSYGATSEPWVAAVGSGQPIDLRLVPFKSRGFSVEQRNKRVAVGLPALVLAAPASAVVRAAAPLNGAGTVRHVVTSDVGDDQGEGLVTQRPPHTVPGALV